MTRFSTLSRPSKRQRTPCNAAALPDLDGQAARVARRFALAAAALELAADITALPAGAGTAGIKQCFDEWHAENGAGKYEDRQIIRNMAAFMQQHAHGLRFADWRDEYTNRDHAGYRKDNGQGEKAEYWIIPVIFEDEIMQGRDKNKACAVLHGIGWMMKAADGRWKCKKYGKGRFYVLLGAEPPEAEAE